MRTCPFCEQTIPDGQRFCSRCGYSMPEAMGTAVPQAPASGTDCCPKCGLPKSQSRRFCVGCGTPLDSSFIPPQPSAPPPRRRGSTGKILLGIVAAVVAIALIISILQGELVVTPSPAPSAPTDAPISQSITIQVWMPPEDQEGNNWLKQMQQRFEANHPEYDITWENQAFYTGDALATIRSDPSAVADVYMYPSYDLYDLISEHALLELPTAYADQVIANNSKTATLSVTNVDDQIYGFPISNNTWFLYYDKAVFSSDDVKSLDTMLTKGKVQLPFYDSWANSSIFLGTGCTILGETGRDVSAGYDFSGNKANIAAKKMVELAKHKNSVIGNLDVYRLGSFEVSAAFGGSWNYEYLKDCLGERLGVAMLPSFTIDKTAYQMTAMSNTCCVGVNPSSNQVEGKQEICLEFAAFLASREGQLLRYETVGTIPANMELSGTPLIMNDPLATAEIKTMMYASALQPCSAFMENYWSIMNTFGRNIGSGSITSANYINYVTSLNKDLNT